MAENPLKKQYPKVKKGKYPGGEGRPAVAGAGGGITAPRPVKTGVGPQRANMPPKNTIAPSANPISGRGQEAAVKSHPPSGKEVKGGFEKRFQKLDRPERHKLVEKVMAKKFGKTDWRQKVYGKDYKAGTVKGLNKDVKEGHEKGKRISGYLKEAQTNLAKASGNTDNKAKVEGRIKELTEAQKKSGAVTEQKKEKRQTYLDRRNKALGNIQATAKRNPQALKVGRKKLAEQKIKENQKATERKGKESTGKNKKKKDKETTKTGGISAA